MRTALRFEFLILFIVLPGTFALRPLPCWPLPVLWAAAAYCYVVLRRLPKFNPRLFWRLAPLGEQWRSILATFLPAALALTAAIYVFAPQLFFNLPRRRPANWMLIMLLYPALSVVPQTIIYRAFLFHRYGSFLRSRPARILVSAACFSWLHIVLRNPIAPLLTLPGGVLFAWRYARTESILASALEHALYGCLIFTIGLGAFFFSSAAR
jgi:membrane protease YdiL (CAAX protease family)